MAYTYDPSQKIEQGFGKASADIGNVFTAVIAQQQRDYNLAENTFQNIEALKKNLNIFGQKNITAKANDLLAQTSSAILKDGKLDYAKLGEMRQQISSIGDLKAGYDIGAKEYERMLQLGIANKDNLFSFEKFYKDLSAKMGDENLVRNPQDLQKSLVETYSNNLDSGAMFGKDYLKRNPLKPASIDVIDPKTGALNRISGELAYGWSYNAQGKMIPPASVTTTDPITGAPVILDYVDQELAKLKAMNPDLLAQLRKQTGSAGVNLSDKEIVKFNLDRTPTGTANITQVRSANQIKGEELTVTKGTFDVEHQKQEFNAKMGQIGASTAASNANTKLINKKISALDSSGNTGVNNLYTDKITVPESKTPIDVDGVSLGKPVKININGQQGVATDIYRSTSTGDIYAKVLLTDKGAFTTDEVLGVKSAYRKIDKPSIFSKELAQKITLGGYSKEDASIISSQTRAILNPENKVNAKLKGFLD